MHQAKPGTSAATDKLPATLFSLETRLQIAPSRKKLSIYDFTKFYVKCGKITLFYHNLCKFT